MPVPPGHILLPLARAPQGCSPASWARRAQMRLLAQAALPACTPCLLQEHLPRGTVAPAYMCYAPPTRPTVRS
eukprot:4330892-Alexandrium_andersonii.AAC.1